MRAQRWLQLMSGDPRILALVPLLDNLPLGKHGVGFLQVQDCPPASNSFGPTKVDTKEFATTPHFSFVSESSSLERKCPENHSMLPRLANAAELAVLGVDVRSMICI